ncbi:hypothetical protein SLS58_006363 [Diplodia intermedia]|uniref:Uncharacterized protein n=1 Tax=Diplodia intermedia TaxID=856260 RepID=A0ABR3TNF1_9PEZI
MVNIPWKRRSKSGHHTRSRSPSRERHFHPLVPLASNPCDGADYASAVFSQRHEAAPDELCFDLFFVANLATFTAYHTVDDGASLAAYVGFFAILWATWFQVTLHDVRFARDSVYERGCKVVQFGAFVGLALAGSKFEPVENARAGGEGGNANLRLLCWVLVLSRVQLALQYVFVGVAVARKRFSKLYLPLGLNVAVYAGAAAAFGVLALAFREGEGKARPGVYWVWWVVLFVEGVGTIAISCWWRMLSFKKTHLVERMGLLTLIVIGEGAIGVTKTVSKMMGKTGVDWQGTLLVGCIVLTLVFLFLTYFDNQPHGHYGTIRQQIWALLHFPFQLAVVGVGEGSQQLALARYIINSIAKFKHKIVQYCVDDGLEGDALVEKLSAAIKYYQLDKKPECYRQVMEIKAALTELRNATGICAAAHTSPSSDWPHAYPRAFEALVTKVGSGITMSTGMKMPADAEPWAVLQHSWRVVYIYYWSALFVVFACLIAFLALIRARRARFDLFDATSIGGRVGMLALCLFFGCVGLAARQSASASDSDEYYDYDDGHRHHEIYRRFLASGLVLPTGTLMLGVALAVDHVARAVCNWRLRRQGYEQPPLMLVESPAGEHHHHHHHVTHNRNGSNVSSSGGGGKTMAAGEADDIDEVLAKRRALVRESRAVGFRRQEAPRPSSAIYLLGNFAAGLSSVGDVERQQGDGGGGGHARSSSGATLTNPPSGGSDGGSLESIETGYFGPRFYGRREDESED